MAHEIRCTEDREWLTQVDQQLERHLGNSDFTIQQLALSLYISERQLRRRVKTLTGVGPVEYLTQKRLDQAHYLLSIRRYRTVAQVARAVGFGHPGAFTRAFKRAYGCLPTEMPGEGRQN